MEEQVNAERCPREEEHYEPGKPDGYLDRQEWFKEMAKTYQQTRCDGCNLYVIWVPKLRCKKCGSYVVHLALHMRRHHP